MTFAEYVREYGLERVGGLLLRYLSDAYKALVQTVPERGQDRRGRRRRRLRGRSRRSVDSSLLDEWEALRAGVDAPIEDDGGALRRADPTITHGFAVMVRNEAFRWARLVARRDHEALAEAPHDDGSPWRPSQLAAALAPYWEEHDEVLLDADARSSAYLDVERRADDWVVTQILRDPLDTKEWRIVGRVDLAALRARPTVPSSP